MASLIIRIKKAFGMLWHYYIRPDEDKLGAIGENSIIKRPADIKGPQNLFLGKNVLIGSRSTFMTIGNGKCVIKDNSGSAEGLTVICSNHIHNVGDKHDRRSNDDNEYFDIIVEEDVWLGYNVTLLPGSYIGRGSVIGAGSVVRSKVPPYAVVTGNPAKVIGFKFTPNEVLEHEKALYSENDRLSMDVLEKNYSKYFINRINEIREWNRI